MPKKIRPRNVLVTGGAGFIGSHLCEELVRRGHNVVALDNFLSGNAENLAALKDNPRFTLLNGDANDPETLKDAFRFQKPHWVFHYAAVVGVKRTEEDPTSVLRDVEGLKSICDLSKFYGVKRLMFSSSSEIYGEPRALPEFEESAVDARKPYAQVKILGESFLNAYYQKFGLGTTSFRFFNVYGPRQDFTEWGFVVGIFIDRVLRGLPPVIHGDGSMTRQFVYITDNVNATIAAVTSKKTLGKVVNIGDNVHYRANKGTTMLELANKIIKATGMEKKIKPVFEKDKYADSRPIHRFPSTERMRKYINYRCQYDLDRGLKETIKWYKKHVLKR